VTVSGCGGRSARWHGPDVVYNAPLTGCAEPHTGQVIGSVRAPGEMSDAFESVRAPGPERTGYGWELGFNKIVCTVSRADNKKPTGKTPTPGAVRGRAHGRSEGVRGRVGPAFTSGSPGRRPRVSASRRRMHADGRNGAREAMERGPAIFAGAVFALFGGGLLVWTATSLRQRRPVAHGVSPVASATLAGLAAVIALILGTWCFSRL
jgi:hypothetical protein